MNKVLPEWCKYPYIKHVQIQNNGIDHTTVKIKPDGTEIAIFEESQFLVGFHVINIMESTDNSEENSLLVQLDKETYLFINDDIYQFSLSQDEFVYCFFSPFGPKGIPNSWIVVKQKTFQNKEIELDDNEENCKTYLLIEQVIIPCVTSDLTYKHGVTPFNRFHRIYKTEKIKVTYIRKGLLWEYYTNTP